MTTASSSGTAPPASPVPEPRATNGTPWRAATRTHACTSAVEFGKHTTPAAPEMFERVSGVQAPLGAARAHTIGHERGSQIVDERFRNHRARRYRRALAVSAALASPSMPDDLHEWVSFEDPDEQRTWVFDVTFLLSSWSCIYGHGCKGVLTRTRPRLEQGCCSYGAHFVDEDDVANVVAHVERLSSDQWEYKKKAAKKGFLATSKPERRRDP